MLEIFQTFFSPPRNLIFLVAAAWLGLALAEMRSERHGISRAALNNIVFYSLIAYIVGGRVLFVTANLPAFAASPLGLFSINADLFDPFGGAALAVLTGWAYGRRQKLPLWSTLDALVPFLATLAVGVGLSHLAAGTAFGQPTALPWAVEQWGALRHPTQAYETLAALAILLAAWLIRTPRPSGLLFLYSAAAIAASRLLLEAWRGDSRLVLGGFRQAQLGAWLALGICLALIDRRLRSPQPLAAEELSSPPAPPSLDA